MYRLTSYLSLEEILAVYDPFGDNFVQPFIRFLQSSFHRAIDRQLS